MSPEFPVSQVLGISIDLSDSTEMKARIAVFAEKDAELANQLLGLYLAGLAGFERDFLDCSLHEGVDLEKLFLVKSIGDELWYAYDITRLEAWEVERAAVKLLRALLLTASKSYPLVLSEDFNLEQMMADPLPDPNELRYGGQHAMTVKCTIDDLGVVIVYDEVRLRTWLRKPPEYFRQDLQWATKDPERAARSLSRLGGVAARVNDGKLAIAHRSDFIGLGVDRFFRLTKYGQAGLVTVGQTLLQKLQIIDEIPFGAPKGSAIRRSQFREPLSAESHRSMIAFSVLGAATDMKGIEGQYEYRNTMLDSQALELLGLPLRSESSLTQSRDPRMATVRALRSEGLSRELIHGKRS